MQLDAAHGALEGGACVCLPWLSARATTRKPTRIPPGREVTEGLSPECPTVWDPVLNGTREEEQCAQRLGVVKGTRCDFKTQVGATQGPLPALALWALQATQTVLR